MTTAEPTLQKKEEKDQLDKNEEKDEDNEEDEAPPSTIEKKLREKPKLPSVKFLLEHGDPASPESDTDSRAFIGTLFVVFILSFAVWHFIFLRGDNMMGAKKKFGSEF